MEAGHTLRVCLRGGGRLRGRLPAFILVPGALRYAYVLAISRLPGRGLSNFDVSSLTELLREAEQHHGQYEPTAPRHHWSGWYAAYMVARQEGKASEEAVKEASQHIERAGTAVSV